MNSSAARIAHRFIHGDALINLDSIPIVLTGGVVSAGDLERALERHDIEAHDVVIYRLDDDPPSVFRWTGRGVNNTTVRGQLVLHVAHDRKHLAVTAEIVLAARYAASQGDQDDAPATEPMLPAKERFMLISSICRRAIADLRANPKDISAVLMHLNDVVELAEQPGWAVD